MKPLLTIILSIVTTCLFGQKAPSNSGKPFTIGVIEELQSRELAEKRLLNIYLPEDYYKDDTSRYAVIYLLDGSADEDFIHVSGIVQFYSFPWIKRIPKSIVVGISTVDRQRDFTFPTTIQEDKKLYPTSGHSDQFIAFIEKELQPFIGKNYRINQSKTIIGQSLGGLLASEILLQKPELFDNYLIISPSIWWDNGSLLSSSQAQLKRIVQQKHVYIGVGKEGLAPSTNPRVMEVDANLLTEKITAIKNPAIHVNFDYLPNEDHATISHQAILNGLKIIYP